MIVLPFLSDLRARKSLSSMRCQLTVEVTAACSLSTRRRLERSQSAMRMALPAGVLADNSSRLVWLTRASAMSMRPKRVAVVRSLAASSVTLHGRHGRDASGEHRRCECQTPRLAGDPRVRAGMGVCRGGPGSDGFSHVKLLPGAPVLAEFVVKGAEMHTALGRETPLFSLTVGRGRPRRRGLSSGGSCGRRRSLARSQCACWRRSRSRAVNSEPKLGPHAEMELVAPVVEVQFVEGAP